MEWVRFLAEPTKARHTYYRENVVVLGRRAWNAKRASHTEWASLVE